jgi:hypothetical protein
MWLTLLVVVLLFAALGGGGLGYSRYGAPGMSPAALILLILVVLYLSGNLHLG